MDEFDYFTNENYSEDERRNTAFQTVLAIREAVSIAQKASIPLTYENAYEVLSDLNPALFEAVIGLLRKKNPNEYVRYYIEKAETLTEEEAVVYPLDLINEDLNEVEGLLEKSDSKKPTIVARKLGLISARDYFEPQKVLENTVLKHDFYLQGRGEEIVHPGYRFDNYKDYKIGKEKILRIRLLHPERAEEILGVDMVYEHFDLKEKKVRFAHMQYKMWDNRELYLSTSKNLVPQLDKMKGHLCSGGYCKGPTDSDDKYRFPYCSGFLRPTSKMQSANSKLISTGIHIPICQASRLLARDSKITSETCRTVSVKGAIFEDLFNSNIAGSHWMSFEQLEAFYVSKDIKSHINVVRIHAQEIDVYTEADQAIDKGL